MTCWLEGNKKNITLLLLTLTFQLKWVFFQSKGHKTKVDFSFLNKTFHNNFYNDFSAACLYCNIDKNVTVLLPFFTRICDTWCEHVSIKRFSLVPLFFLNPLISFCNPVPLSTQPAHTLTHSHAHTHWGVQNSQHTCRNSLTLWKTHFFAFWFRRLIQQKDKLLWLSV